MALFDSQEDLSVSAQAAVRAVMDIRREVEALYPGRLARVQTVSFGVWIHTGEVALETGLRDLTRLLNQDIEYGGGENPFKGLRWPFRSG